jgi:Na+/melibiose symporter-like transporter
LFNLVGGIALVRLIALFMDRYWTEGGSSWLWLSLAVLGMVLLGTMLVTVFTVKERPRTGTPQVPLLSSLRGIFRIDVKVRRDFILFLVAFFLIDMALGTLMAHALYYFLDVFGIANLVSGTADFLIWIGIGMLVAVYPAGRLSDRIGRRPIVVSAGLIGALGVVVLFFTQNYTYVLISGVILGICGGAWVSSSWALATDLVGKGEEARYMGLVNMSVAGAGAAARLIGPLIDFFNAASANLGYQVMLAACFIYLVMGSALLMKVRIRR